MRSWLPLSAFIIILSLFTIPRVLAESLSVSLRVGDTRISFDGYTSPSAFITITQNSAVVGTTVADVLGNFTKEIDADNPGIQSFELYAEDSGNLLTPTITYNVNLTANTLTSISNIVFPPTISLDSITTTISGMTNPAATLTLLVSDGSSVIVPVAIDGTWSRAMTDYAGGTYSAYAIATMPGGYMSLESETVNFTIPSTSTSSPAPTSSSEPSTTTVPSASSQPATTTPITRLFTRPTESSTPSQPSQTSIFYVGNFITIARPISFLCFFLFLFLILTLLRFILFLLRRRRRQKRKNNR